VKKDNSRDPERAAEDTPEICPPENDLFSFIEDPDVLDRKKKTMIDRHLRQCPLCHEEISQLRAKLNEGDSETQRAVEESTIDRLIGKFQSSPEKIILEDRLRDILIRYPSPSARRFDAKKARAWLNRVGEKAGGIGRRLAGIFELSSAGAFELSPAAVRSGAKAEKEKESKLLDLLSDAEQKMAAGEYRQSGECYLEICRLVAGLPLERDARFLAGVAFLRCGDFDLAASNLGDSIGEAAGPENYWFLARALLEKGEIEGAFKSLQVLEGLGGEFGSRATKLLNEMQG